MSRYWILPILGLIFTACTSGPAPAPKPAISPTSAPAAVPTVAPKPVPTAAPAGPDYVKMRGELLAPLGALIVATRNKSENAPMHLAAFNEVAARVEPAIAGDMSVNANRLQSSINNVREATPRKDLRALELARDNLLEVR